MRVCETHKRGLALELSSTQYEKKLTSPARLGLPLTEEATELRELRDEALGLRFRLVGVGRAFRTAGFALAGVVDGKPILVTLCTGAKRPYLDWHWKYLKRRGGETQP